MDAKPIKFLELNYAMIQFDNSLYQLNLNQSE